MPTAEELEKLPLRAIVAYVARTAHRVSSEFRGIIPDHVIDNAIWLVENALSSDSIAGDNRVEVIVAAEGIVAAYDQAPAHFQSSRKDLLVFTFVQAALTAMHAVLAVDDSDNARHHVKRAAECAQLAVTASLAMEAAQQDYNVLLRYYGKNDKVIIGEPVHCFENKPETGTSKPETGTS